MTKLTSLFLISAVALITACSEAPEPASSDGHPQENEAQTWTCSMHPNVQAPDPGLCPICAMDLISLAPGANSDGVVLSQEQNSNSELVTTKVERRPAIHTLDMLGRLHQDETQTAVIAAWANGRIDRLFVDYTGVEVRPGDHLVELFSLDLFNAQQDYVLALQAQEQNNGKSYLHDLSKSTVTAAESRLRQFGISQRQIDSLANTRKAQETIELKAPIGGVVVRKNAKLGQYVKEGQELFSISDLRKLWLVLNAYEKDLAWLRYGQQVEFSVDAFPGETFTGKIIFFEREVDMQTRTLGVRVEVSNPDLRLRPGMLSRAKVAVQIASDGFVHANTVIKEFVCPMHHEVGSDFAGDCVKCGMPLEPSSELGFDGSQQADDPLLIPASAPLITGKRALVYVQTENNPDGVTYEPRPIVLGPRAGDWFVVKEGLEQGEVIVAQSAFILDSEQQINGKFSMMAADQEPVVFKKAEGIPFDIQKQLGAILALYVDLAKSLASDDLIAAQSVGSQIKQQLSKIDVDQISLETFTSFRNDLSLMLDKLSVFNNQDDIEVARVEFEHLQMGATKFAGKYPYHTTIGKLAVFHCPMAFNDRGADWLQFSGEKVENPYFGAAMYRCGLEKNLVPKFK
ncbi:MAG: efflux RND transporter periplasmic adaptor subunit [Planctomycetota bacterium]|nr:efflux RND transporter periplasmic adaptor subunit [Planctomycetota bacterium]